MQSPSLGYSESVRQTLGRGGDAIAVLNTPRPPPVAVGEQGCNAEFRESDACPALLGLQQRSQAGIALLAQPFDAFRLESLLSQNPPDPGPRRSKDRGGDRYRSDHIQRARSPQQSRTDFLG